MEPNDTPEKVMGNVVVGQYNAGSIDGQDVVGYQQEKEVAPGSRTPTFVAMKLWIHSWRWDGVPFYLRSGKRMPKRATGIAFHFRPLPPWLFGAGRSQATAPAFRVQPADGTALRVSAAAPGERYGRR